jgi:hypothetical protein
MRFTLWALAFAGALFVGMLLLLEVGRRVGRRRLAHDAEGARAGLGVVEGSVFGLLGLLLAFTFSGAASRFDNRRQLITQEVNAIGTAWLRTDLLPADARPAIRDGFRRYVDARLAVYRKLPDLEAALQELAISQRIQGEIWAKAAEVCRTEAGAPARMLLLPAMNEMFDVATLRTLSARMHPPTIVFVMLGALALAGALLAGYGMAGGRTRSWIHVLGFAATIAVATYVIVDLEYPRVGLIRVDRFDQGLVDLRASMK